MKKLLFTSALILLAFSFSFAQKAAPYNVVFDMTSHDTVDHKLVVHWIDEIMSGHPDAKVEVVFYGKSLDMVNKDKSIMAEQIKQASVNKNVSFKVCEIALKNNHLNKNQLLPEIQTVPDGIYEIVQKQASGWAYIKVSH